MWGHGQILQRLNVFQHIYWDNKLTFNSFLNLKKVFSLIVFGISFHNFAP